MATPTPTPTPSPPATLVLRVDSADETDAVPYPDVSYYADGLVIRPGAVGELDARRLTTAGLEAVLRRTRSSGLFERDRAFMALLPARGVATVRVSIVEPGGSAITVSAFANAEATGDGARFLELAAALADPAAWLAPDAWTGRSTEPYVPTRIRVHTTIEDVSDPAPWPADIRSVAWPLSTPFDRVGDVITDEPGYGTRCGILPADDALAIRAALLAAGAVPDRDWTGTVPLRYGSDRAISYAFLSVLPDGEPDCRTEPVDPAWALEARIAYARAGASPVVRLLDTRDGSDRAIARGTSLAWSPDGTRLAVLRPRTDGLPDLYVVDTIAGSSMRIVRGVVNVAWSPGGDLLAIARSPVDVGDLWLVRPDGRGLREVPTGGGQFAWSPDGARLAVVTGTGSPMIGILDVVSGKRTDLAPGTDPVWTGEAWSRIAFVEWGSDRLALVDPVTGVATRLAGPDALPEHLVRVDVPPAPGWGLAFVGGGAAWLLDDLGGTARRLAAPGPVRGALSGVPGGAWVAAVAASASGVGNDLVALRTDGDGWFQLTELGDVVEVAAAPGS